MKPLNYIVKYGLDKPHTKIRFEDIVEDFQVDFMALLEIGKARENIKGYENAIRAMHNKFEGIEMKSDASNRKAIKACWNKFYAICAAPLREKLFPKEMAERMAAKKARVDPVCGLFADIKFSPYERFVRFIRRYFKKRRHYGR